MKPEVKAFWKSSVHRLATGPAAAALLLCLAACGVATDTGTGSDTATRLTHARLLVLPGSKFAQPPRKMLPADLPAAGWQDVDLPHIAASGKQADSSDTEATFVHWYWLDGSARTPSSEPRYLYIPRWKTNGLIAVYGNNQLLYQSEGSIFHNGYNQPLLLRLNPGEGMHVPTEVLLRIERLKNSGSALSSIWTGSASALVWRYQARYFLQIQLPFIGAAAFLVVGFFSLAIWTRRRNEWLYFVFFAASTLTFLRMLHYVIGGSYLLISDAWFSWLTVASLLWLIVVLNNFLERLHRRPLRWLNPALIVVTTLCSLAIMPGATGLIPNLAIVTPVLYLMLAPLTIAIFGVALRNALQTGERDTKLMAAWVLFAVPCCIYDLALQNNWVSPEGLYTHGYTMIGLFVMFTYIMYGRYMGAIDAVEQVNANLAERLQTREAELAISYERLREVEYRQAISNERQRLMQDMHDGLGSSLISAIRSVEHGGMSDASVSQVLKDCMDDLKLAIDSMEPVEADLLLLLATLRFRLEPRLEGTGVCLWWKVQEVPALAWLDPSAALHILRIVQESVANILRHTQSTEIRVSTATEGAGVQVIIEDNGQGFDVERALSKAAGRGLNNQQRRAQAIDGTVAWASGPAGTRFTLWLPLERVGSVVLQPDF